MRKFWIFMGILFAIVFGIAIGCAVSDPFKLWFTGGVIYIFGEAGKTTTRYWDGLMATPFYVQWHPLIWIGITAIGAVIFVKALWPRRPKLLGKTVTPSSLASSINLQREPAEPEQAPMPKVKTKEVAQPAVKTEETQKVEA